MKKNLRREFVIWIILLIPFFFLFALWRQLPDKLPSHFGFYGEVNGYSSKIFMAFLTPGIYILMLLLPIIDPKKENYKLFDNSYYKLRFILVLMINVIFILVMIQSVYHNMNMEMVMPIIIFMLVTIVGNYLGSIRQNYFVGIKVPWTLNNEENWNKTHRLAGKLWVAGGLTGIISTILIRKTVIIFPAIFSIIVIVPILYSYILHVRVKKMEDSSVVK